MSYKKEISGISHRVFKKTIRTNDKRWPHLAVFVENYGSAKVVEVFKEWANENADNECIAYPLSVFLESADRLFASAAEEVQAKVQAGDVALAELASELYGINPQQAFADRDYKALGNLLILYDREEIVSGYKEYCGHLDDFGLRRAAHTFAQGGAVAVILNQRRYKVERQIQAENLERARQELKPMVAEAEPEEEFFVPE